MNQSSLFADAGPTLDADVMSAHLELVAKGCAKLAAAVRKR